MLNSIIVSLESRLIMNRCYFFLVLRKTFLGVSCSEGVLVEWRYRKSNMYANCVHPPYGCLLNCKAVSAGGPDLEAAKSAD